MTKKILIGLLCTFVLVLIYYTLVVLIARVSTEEKVSDALQSERMKLELTDLSDKQIQALLKVQDPNFYEHKGVDFITPGTGVTTISQALVKMYYFEDFHAGIEKTKQTLIARLAFDPLTPKDTILTLFINEVYLGQNGNLVIKGFENAAQYYFNKSFKQLSWDEYLSLIAMIRAPSCFNYFNKKEKNLERVHRIKKMLSGEYIPRDNSDLYYDRE